MQPEIFTLFSGEVANRYRVAVSAITGVIMEASLSPNPSSQKQRSSVLAKMHRIAQDATANEIARATANAKAVALSVITDASTQLGKSIDPELRKQAESYADDAALEMVRELERQFARDVDAGNQWFSRFSINVSQLVRSKGWLESVAAMSVQQNMQKPQFTFRDRMGRKWQGSNFVTVHSRSFYLNLYNDLMITVGLANGLDRAYIKHSDAGHETHGIRFKIDPTSPLQAHDYETIRQHYFHPNSKAVVSLTM